MKLWVARDKNGHIIIYRDNEKLCITKSVYCDYDEVIGDYIILPDDYLPEVTFGNSPKEVEVILKK